MQDRLLVLHVADLHLGKNRKHDDYLVQQGFMLEGILSQVSEACKNNPNADVYLCVCGDVFDRNQDTRRAEFCLFLTSFIHPLLQMRRAFSNLRVFIIDGNHDREPLESEPSVLSPLAPLFSDWFQFAVVQPRMTDHDILMLPYGGYSGLQLRAFIDKYTPSFVMAHECLNRMQTDTGWSPPRDQDHYIEIDNVLPDTRVAGVFLGDIHRCQSLDKNEICWYSGSPITLDHGHRPPKGVLHHFYQKTPSGYTQFQKPILTPIDDQRIKTHYQLGTISEIDKIPWDRCYQYFDSYLDLVVTPEIHAEIGKKISGFFSNKQVSWSFDRELRSDPNSPTALDEEAVGMTFYKMAIKEWSQSNLVHLSSSLVDEFTGRVEKLFEGRG